MDYEVFLLSRIKEEYDVSGDPVNSVADGLAATARVISAAAAIMVVVFGAFLLEDMRVIKIFGIGLATAVLLDATLIRMLLVPATMELLGAKNWWLPQWLDRILPAINVEGPAHGHDDDPSDGVTAPGHMQARSPVPMRTMRICARSISDARQASPNPATVSRFLSGVKGLLGPRASVSIGTCGVLVTFCAVTLCAEQFPGFRPRVSRPVSAPYGSRVRLACESPTVFPPANRAAPQDFPHPAGPETSRAIPVIPWR
jgi:RND superfamily putative drug exporter